MMKKLFVIFIFSFLYFHSPQVNAQTPDYPISELGSCRDARECSLYCQIPQNTPACWSYNRYVLNDNILGDTDVNISYPISELGNCNSASSCFVFCNQPQNQTTCYEFAKAKGLIKEKSKVPENIIELAKKELGCKNDLECMVFCQLPDNMDACRAFGQKYNLVPPPDPRQMGPPPAAVAAAKRELGCTNENSCMSFCNNPDNTERCMQFAKKYKLMDEGELERQEESVKKKMEMMEDAKKELGCNSPSSCMSFCQNPENMNKCASLAKKHNFGPSPPPQQQMMQGSPMQGAQMNQQNPQPGGMSPPGQITREDQSIRGPGGCASEKECKAYCEKHPNECPGFPKDKSPSSLSPSSPQSPKPPQSNPPSGGSFGSSQNQPPPGGQQQNFPPPPSPQPQVAP